MRTDFMRNLLPFVPLLFLVTTTAAQSSPSSEPSQQRPTLNRPSSPNATPTPTPTPSSATSPAPTPSPSQSPAAEPAQPGTPVEYPKPSYPDLLPRFDYDSH